MKKILFSGLTALMLFFAMAGFAYAQTHTFTFNPPSGSTVAAGDEIEVTCTPAADISFELFASMEEAQVAAPTIYWDVYGYDGKPTIAAGKTVLKVAVNTGDLANPVWEATYAEYTLDGSSTTAKPNLSLDLSDNKYGMYVPFHAALTYAGEDLQNFMVYYSLCGTTPSRSAYDEDEVFRAEATEGFAEIMLTIASAPYFKAVAYVTVGEEELVSDILERNLTAYEVAKPEFVPAPAQLSALEVEPNTILKIKDNTLTGKEDEVGATILYSTDGETLPLQSAYYDDDDPNVFLYKDEDGIKITKDMVIWAIAYKSIGGDDFGVGQPAGSEMLRGRFVVTKPTVNVSLSTKEWIIGSEAPTVNVTMPEGFVLGTEEGNVAVRLYIYSDNPEEGWEQIITASGTALDMAKAIEANHEDEWMIRCSLVKGNATTELFEGNVAVSQGLSLVIMKDGERPAKPEFSIPGGEVEKGTEVTLSCATQGATLYYTYGDVEVSVPYRQPFIINSDCTIRAMAEKDGIQSDIARAVFTIKVDPLPPVTVTVTPAPGEIAAGTELKIEVSEELGDKDIVGYKLYPTVDSANNDITFNNTYIEYPAEGNPVPTVENPVLRVGVFRSAETPREIRQWDYFVFTYLMMKDIPMPVITPAGGEVEQGTEVEIKLAEGAEGATIYYTVDGNEPTKESLEYTEKIVINEALTLKAIAIKTTDGKDSISNVAEAVFTIKKPSTAIVANELAGVKVYPNPNAGTFNVAVPERANIEIFGLNGAKVMSREMNAGVETFSIERSGIYFVRVMAGNKAAVKRVVVR